jgi:hypothetical protein
VNIHTSYTTIILRRVLKIGTDPAEAISVEESDS